jgi:peroxiredoxin
MPLGVGYASQKVTLKDANDQPFVIGGQNGHTQLIIAAPFIDENLIAELKEIDTLLVLNGLVISKSLVVATKKHTNPMLDEWNYGYDYDTQFGDYYGVRLGEGELCGEFTKALFIVSKDGALFYDEILKDLNESFSLEKTIHKIAAAMNCYTGHGCHG